MILGALAAIGPFGPVQLYDTLPVAEADTVVVGAAQLIVPPVQDTVGATVSPVTEQELDAEHPFAEVTVTV